MFASPWDKKISNSYALKRVTKGKFVLGCSAKALQNPDPVSVKKKYLKKEIKTSWNESFSRVAGITDVDRAATPKFNSDPEIHLFQHINCKTGTPYLRLKTQAYRQNCFFLDRPPNILVITIKPELREW